MECKSAFLYESLKRTNKSLFHKKCEKYNRNNENEKGRFLSNKRVCLKGNVNPVKVSYSKENDGK